MYTYTCIGSFCFEREALGPQAYAYESFFCLSLEMWSVRKPEVKKRKHPATRQARGSGCHNLEGLQNKRLHIGEFHVELPVIGLLDDNKVYLPQTARRQCGLRVGSGRLRPERPYLTRYIRGCGTKGGRSILGLRGAPQKPRLQAVLTDTQFFHPVSCLPLPGLRLQELPDASSTSTGIFHGRY